MPTLKQKETFDKIVENHGSISSAMREVGYEENTAKNPKNLTESKGWQELMATYLPDELLAQKHKALLNKADDKGNIDVQAVSKGLDMGYKLKGAYAPEKNINLNLNGEIIPNEELQSLAKQLNDIARNNNRTSIPGDGTLSNVVDTKIQD